MKAVLFEAPGGTDRLKVADVEMPRPAAREVLLRVRYCGVNPLDRSVLSGLFPARPMPHIPGSEIGGVVEALGPGVQGPGVGEEVVVYNRLFDDTCPACLRGQEQTCDNGGIIGVVTQGGYAEYVVVPARNLIPVPPGLELSAATAASLSGLTAWHAVLGRGRLRAAETLAVFGATGGVGSFAVQIGRLAGARVVAVTRDRGEEDRLRELGADAVVIAGEGDTAEAVRAAAGGRGVDLVLDPLGEATWEASFAAVAPNGRWATCGALTGAKVALDLRALYGRQIELIGSTGGTRAELHALLALLARGQLRAPVGRTYPLVSAAEALTVIGRGEHFGKVLLDVPGGPRA